VIKRLYFSEYEFVLQSKTHIVPKGLPSGQRMRASFIGVNLEG
jgi:hypothetical protein